MREQTESCDTLQRRLRALPAVDQLAAAVRTSDNGTEPSRSEATAVARAVLTERRAELLAGASDDVDLCVRARRRLAGSLRRVLNGTGVILHTNLGRAPLPSQAAEALLRSAESYVNLEIDLTTADRRSRDQHIADLLRELTGADDALAVNNGAAALLLASAALAGPGASIVVSRGQLVEIGGGFRIPDIVMQAGARLLEVGTTNRTHIEDYRAALDAGGTIILRVHPSNFRIAGFTAAVDIVTLCRLGAPVIDDVGSGVLRHDCELLADEPSVTDSVHAGAALVCFSGDKLLGGPQAGILVGSSSAIEACRRHPLYRPLRLGRLALTALAATLALYRDPARALREVPALAMLCSDRLTLESRARRLAAMAGGDVVDGIARVGGGALPMIELSGPAVALDAGVPPDRLHATLRRGEPPLVARVADGRVLVDPRTLRDDEIEAAAAAIRAALTKLDLAR